MKSLQSINQGAKELFQTTKWLLLLGISIMVFIGVTAFVASRFPIDTIEGMTYYRPVGGEDRQVERVRLSCQLSTVEGYPEDSLWCQEIIKKEEAN